MKAIQIKESGGPEVMTLVDIPVPKPKANEALVKITASGVNFVDIYVREGRYKTQLPMVIGQEAAGVVTEVGAEVANLKPGVVCTAAMPNMRQCRQISWCGFPRALATSKPRRRCCRA